MTLNLRVIFAIFLAFVLAILPLPYPVMAFRPPWILLLLLYIQLYLPNYFSISLLLILGLCLDALLVTPIGEHAFALILTTWFATRKARRFQFFSRVQQLLLIGLYCLVYQLIIFLMEAFMGYHNEPLMLMGATLFSLFVWPWLRVLADSTLCYDVRL